MTFLGCHHRREKEIRNGVERGKNGTEGGSGSFPVQIRIHKDQAFCVSDRIVNWHLLVPAPKGPARAHAALAEQLLFSDPSSDATAFGEVNGPVAEQSPS